MTKKNKEVSRFFDDMWVDRKMWKAHIKEDLPDADGNIKGRDIFLKRNDLKKSWFKGKRVLDAGCGWGRKSMFMASLGATVYAVDLCDLSIAKEYAGEYKKNIFFINSELQNLPFEDNFFDLVLCEGVLHHMDEYIESFNELSRVCKKGGLLIVGLHGKGGIMPTSFTILRSVLPLSMKRLTKKLPHGGIIWDNLTVPIIHRFTEREIRNWFELKDFDSERMIYQHYDYRKRTSKIMHGAGWIIMKGKKFQSPPLKP